MGRNGMSAFLIPEVSELRDGDSAASSAGVDFMNGILLCCGLELHSGAIVGSAKVCWVVDIDHDLYLEKDFLSVLDIRLQWVNAIQTPLNDWLKSGRRMLLYSFGHSCFPDVGSWRSSPEEPSEASIPAYAVVVSAVVLLAFIYHYLTGNVDRGGSKAYSRSSLDFRDIYVAIVLFLGAYVWIKFREVAFKGVHLRKLVDKQGGIKVVYDARLTPPMWNGRKVPRLELGRFSTPQEAHNKFLIAAFYYDRRSSAECLLDGWFQVPPMSEEERSLTGLELRAWVIRQAKKVYEDFQKKKAEAALLLQELLEACEDQVTQEQVEVNVDFSMVSFLSVAEHRQPAFVSEVENAGMGVAMIGDNHGLECASHSFDGMHEGLALPIGYSLGSQEGSALPVSQLPPNTESGMSMNGSDQLNLLQTLVSTLQQQISDQQQQISDQQQNIREFGAQILLLQHQQRIQQQQLQESRIQNPQSPCQFCLQQQQLQIINQGFPSFEVEMEEQSMHQHNYPGLMTPPPDGGEVQEGFSELDTLMYM